MEKLVICLDCELETPVESFPEKCPVCSGRSLLYAQWPISIELPYGIDKSNPWRPRD